MNPAPRIHIGTMRVRMPGASKEAGCALAQNLREQLGRLPARSAGTHIGALHLRIPAGPSVDARSASGAIAAAVSNKLTRG